MPHSSKQYTSQKTRQAYPVIVTMSEQKAVTVKVNCKKSPATAESLAAGKRRQNTA